MRQSVTVMDRGVGALLREVAKLEKFKNDTIETFGRSHWDVQQMSAAMAAALITCTRGEVVNAGEEDSQCVSPGDGLPGWHAVMQWFKPRSSVGNRLRRWRGSYRQSAPRT